MNLPRIFPFALLFLVSAFVSIARAAPGDVDTSYSVTPSFGYIYTTAFQQDGRMIIGGSFDVLSSSEWISKVGRHQAGSSSFDTAFRPILNDEVRSITTLADGKIILGGRFTTVGGVVRNRIARVHPDGSLDTAFDPNVGGSASIIHCSLVEPDGKILIGGSFPTVGGVTRNGLARVHPDGTLDAIFNPNVNGTVHTLTRQPDGKLVMGGNFTSVGGEGRKNLARIQADGAVDFSFSADANLPVYSLAAQVDGKILVGGSFSTIGGATRNRLVRLNSDSSIDTTFIASTNSQVNSISVQANGKILIGGEFTILNSNTRPRLARLNPDGTLDSAFNSSPNNRVYGTALQADGKVVITGEFDNLGSTSRFQVARLQNDAATQALTVPSSNRIQWLRGASSPETTQVEFQIFTGEGAGWTPLGAGTRISGGWELVGLALPPGGQIRALARTQGGYYNGSSSLVEAVASFGSQAEIAVEQASVNIPDGGSKAFGNVEVGTSSNLTFTIKNTGGSDLTGLGITVDGMHAGDFTIISPPTPPVPGAGGMTTFNVNFAPAEAGSRTATLRIASNDFDETSFDITLTGNGTGPGISVDVQTLAIPDGGSRGFGDVRVGTNSSQLFTIRNPGTAPLAGLYVTFDGGDAADFSITAGPGSSFVPAGGTTTFTVRFAPSSGGAKAAALHIHSNAAGINNPYDINLTGAATEPEIVVEEPYLTNVPDGGGRSFPNVVVGSNASLTFVVRNAGSGPLSGLGVTIAGPNAAEFSVTSSPTSTINGPDEVTSFVVRFAPTSAGAKTAALQIANDDADENPFDINVTGTGLVAAPEMVVEQPAFSDVQDGDGRNFGNVSFGDNRLLTFTIRNTGHVTLTSVTNMTISGDHASDFSISEYPNSVVFPGSSTPLVVRFSPTGAGLRTAVLRITTNDPDESPFDIILTGTGSVPGAGDASFNPNADSHVLSTSLQADGKIIIGGAFETLDGISRGRLARLNADGSLDAAFNPGANDWVYCTAVQEDGKILVGGTFTSIAGGDRNGIARLNADGTLDAGFNPGANGWVFCTALLPDGKILIGGSFSEVGGMTRPGLARLNANGSVDAAFDPTFDGSVYSLALQEDGKIVVSGNFTAVDDTPRNHLARLTAGGALEASFNPNPNGPVYTTVVQPDGKLLVGGSFTTMGGAFHQYMARLNSSGTPEEFDASLDGAVNCIALQADGKIILGGNFTRIYSSSSPGYLGRIHASGSRDATFIANANGPVYSAILQADGRVVVGGDFTNVGGFSRNRITRLENDVATQTLTLAGNSRAQWLRGGASPEAEWVSFDLSVNGGSSWSPLGKGTRSRLASGWELSGLSLPPNGLVRARAHITGGYSNGSAGLVEAVASVSGPPAPEIAVEQPALSLVSDGGSRDFGNTLVAGEKSLVFTILNAGSADLTGLGITFIGTDASDFSVSANPASLIPGTGSTSFTVTFAPATAGTKAATLRIASNDADENPFDINLAGRALVSSADDDGDSISNGIEVALVQLGFDPFIDSSALRAILQANAAGLGLSSGGINEEFLALGNPVLEKNPSTGKFHLRLSLERSTNLGTWSPLPGFTPTFDPINGEIDVEIPPGGSSAEFLRVFGAKP